MRAAHSPLACSPKSARLKKWWAWVSFLLFLGPFSALAQGEIRFEASVSAKEIVVGVPFEVVFTLKNAEGSRFTPPPMSGFNSGGISEMRGMSIVNGRSSSSQSWVIELTAAKPGTYTIGPAQVTVGAKVLRSEPLQLQVLPVSASSKGQARVPPGADDKIFLSAVLDRKQAYPGQQVTWRVLLYTQLSVDGYDVIEMPSFEGFFSVEKTRFDKRVEHVSLRGKQYAVRTLLEEALFPQSAGEFEVGAATVRVGVAQSGPQGFLFGPKPVNLSTQPLRLTVKNLPQPLPPHFCGAVGRYRWDIRADSLAITTDGALTLTVEVQGNGDARRLAAPKFEVSASCEIFEPRILEEEEYESETEVVQRKKWEYVVLPKDTGLLEIALKTAYFDPDSNHYTDLTAAPIRLHVSPGKNYGQNAPPFSLVSPDAPVYKPLWERLSDVPWVWATLALPALFLGFWAWRRRRADVALPPMPPSPGPPAAKSQDLPGSRQVPPTSLFSARQQLASLGNALNGGDPRHFYELLFKGLQSWLAARLGLSPAQMNDKDISELLVQRGAAPIRAQALMSVWHACEQAVYGGGAPAEQMGQTWQMALQVIDALEKELR